MGFGQAVKTCLFRKYSTFPGRASRSEFWWFSLFYWFSLVIGLIVGSAFVAFSVRNVSCFEGACGYSWAFGMFFMGIAVFGVHTLLLITPMMAVTVRRLHDVGWSGGWCLLYIILHGGIFCSIPIAVFNPGAGLNLFLALMAAVGAILARSGEVGTNRFGHNPLKPDHPSDILI